LQKLIEVLIPFALITGSAGQYEVTDTIRAVAATGMRMIQLQRHLPRSAIGALMVPLQQHIFTHFIAFEGSLLILDAFDSRIRHRLRVEAHEFLTDGCDWAQPHEPTHPCDDIVCSTLQ